MTWFPFAVIFQPVNASLRVGRLHGGGHSSSIKAVTL